MKKRTQYLIDRKFQLRHTFSIIGLKFIIIALITGIIVFNAVFNNTQLSRNNTQLQTIVNDQSNVVIIQDNIVEALLTYSQAVKDKSQKKAINDVYQNHSKNMKTIQHNIDSIKEIITLNDRVIRFTTVLLIIICVFVLLQGFVLYFMLIRKTHRISGPIYVMSMYIRQIIDGKIPDHIRKLRKNDELQEFYDLFGQMVKSLKKSNGS
jgi:nitrogen fixation/metabolism regulation signal transduction histidine kinase